MSPACSVRPYSLLNRDALSPLRLDLRRQSSFHGRLALLAVHVARLAVRAVQTSKKKKKKKKKRATVTQASQVAPP